MQRGCLWTQVGDVIGGMLVLSLATAIPEAAAKAKSLSGCTTILVSGSYVLSKSIAGIIGTCFRVAADFVTIDLDGQVLTGDGTGSGVAVSNIPPFPKGTVVRNGTITGFLKAVELSDGTDSRVEWVNVFSNNQGILVGARSTISHSMANLTQNNGIQTGADSLVSYNHSNLSFAGSGIVAGDNSTVSYNSASGNAASGIVVGKRSTVSNNTANDNFINGINVPSCSTAADASNLHGNTAKNNTGGNTTSLMGCGNFDNVF